MLKDIERYVIDYFETKFDKTENGCWLWKQASDKDGYGSFKFKRKVYRAHRFSYMLYKGEIPDGMMVLHKCDVRNCINPEHLFLGTAKDNAQDAAKKGRIGNRKGHEISEEQKAYHRLAMMGYSHNDKTKEKIRIASTGRKHTEKSKLKMSETMKGNKSWLGKNHSEETKEKLRNIFKGHSVSEEAREKMRAAKLGKKMSEDTRKKMSDAQKRRHKKEK